MSGNSLPMTIENERLWILGILGIISIAVAVGGIWAVVPTGTATFQVEGTSDDTPVTVTVERQSPAPDVVAQKTVTGRQAAVFKTNEPEYYAVTISTEGESCEGRVLLTRENSRLRQELIGFDGGDCPVDFTVRMTPW